MYTAARKVIFTAAQTLICRICARAARQAQEPVRMPLATFRPLVGEPRAARRRTGAHPGLVKIPPCLCKLHRQARINDSARDSDQMSGSLAACSGAIAGAQARTTRRSQARTNRRAGQHPRRRAVECAGAHGSAASPIPPTRRAGGWGGGGAVRSLRQRVLCRPRAARRRSWPLLFDLSDCSWTPPLFWVHWAASLPLPLHLHYPGLCKLTGQVRAMDRLEIRTLLETQKRKKKTQIGDLDHQRLNLMTQAR